VINYDYTTYPIFMVAIAKLINVAGSGSGEGLQVVVAARDSGTGS
jgi:hypothetical protein